MGRPSSTEQKLDMSLEDLVKKERSSEGYGPAGRAPKGDRDRPYSEAPGDAQDRGKGKSGKRRLPPDEKAWLHTQCFFRSESEFVVKLYDTEILRLRKNQQDLQASKENTGTQQEKTDDKKPDDKQSDEKETDDKPSDESKSDDKKTDDKISDDKKTVDKPAGGLVLVMTSGGFRTAETKIILNEALKPMAIRIDGSESSRWTVVTDYKTPGAVTGEASSKPFEDGMEFHSPSLVTLESVRDHMAERQKAAQVSADRPRGRGQPMPPPGSSVVVPPHIPPHHPPHGWPPPPHAWGMPPPPGWRPPLYPHAPPGMHPYPPWGGGPWAGGYRPPYPHHYGPPRAPPHGFPAAPPGAPALPPGAPGARPPPAAPAAPAAPAGPVSDDMFQ